MHRSVIVGLPAILIAYLALVHSQASPAWFGYYHDDSLYWTAARSLAEGDGYRMASVPGTPPQTKYPVLFPWALSWVWRVAPEFPANLSLAVWTVAFGGAAFVGGCFVLLRQFGLPDGVALWLTAVCAAQPVVVHLSGLLLSDVPFMALVVWCLVFSYRALTSTTSSSAVGPSPAVGYWAAAFGLAALACMARSIGVTLFAGMALAAVWRRAYRPAAACVALAVALAVLPLLFRAGPAGADASSASGYQQTLQFYGSYLSFWKLSTPDWPTFAALLSFNFRELVKQPAITVFSIPASGFSSFGWQLAAVAISFTIVKGMVALAMARRHPAFLVLAAYAGVVLVWNYTLMDRFFAWAVPLFLAGAWSEIGRLTRLTLELFRPGKPLLDRAVAAVVMAAFAALGVYSGYRYLWVVPEAMAAKRTELGQMQTEKQQAYEWIRQNTAAADRFIADEDASLYLYTGRQALRPMAFSTAAFYLQSEAALDQDLARLTDSACGIGARYWLSAADDYHLESAQEFIQKRTAEVLAGRPAVYVSPGGGVRIYDISGLTSAGGEAAARGAIPYGAISYGVIPHGAVPYGAIPHGRLGPGAASVPGNTGLPRDRTLVSTGVRF
ncbi:MAG: hypothetical protein WD733_22395 [Bryobacterales bacterium]